MEHAGRIVDLAGLSFACGHSLPTTALEFIRAGAGVVATVRAALTELPEAVLAPHSHEPASIRLLAPIARPGKILCSGINYRSHCDENPQANLPDDPCPMATVLRESFVKTYLERSGPGVTAVKCINLAIEDREFMVLVGPSGCGKSTTD